MKGGWIKQQIMSKFIKFDTIIFYSLIKPYVRMESRTILLQFNFNYQVIEHSYHSLPFHLNLARILPRGGIGESFSKTGLICIYKFSVWHCKRLWQRRWVSFIWTPNFITEFKSFFVLLHYILFICRDRMSSNF